MKTSQITLESMNKASQYNHWLLDKFKQYLKGDVLEIGCGIGNFTKTLSFYSQVWAIDINKEYINKTRELVNESAQVGYGDIETGQFFFTNKEFDTVVCLNVLEHIKNDQKALQNIKALLKNGGHLVLIVPISQYLYGAIDKSINHYRRYQTSQIIELLKKEGFTIISSRKLNWLGAIGWFVAGKILKENNVANRDIKIFNLLAPIALWLEDFIEPPIGTSVLIIAKKR